MHPQFSVAVVGAGLAGATCARALARAGCAVQVFDKSRGAGGRLATRRLEWVDGQGRTRTARFDHGAPGFAATSAEFRRFLDAAAPMHTWEPRLAPGSRPLEGTGTASPASPASPLWLPQPDMPALCRALLHDVPATWSCVVDGLRRAPGAGGAGGAGGAAGAGGGWQLQAAGATLPGRFDAVVLALPPAQAAPLLAAHRADWAQRASLALMQPCWTLMAVARRPEPAPAWDLARPQHGPLAWVMRSDARPGREADAAAAGDVVHWVAHARAGWSRQHLEQPAEWVQLQLLGALQDVLREAQGEAAELGTSASSASKATATTAVAGADASIGADIDTAAAPVGRRPGDWLHAVVHRWRYATPAAGDAAPSPPCWWDGARGLGVCGDFFGRSPEAAAEGAWRSAQALVEALLADREARAR